MNIAFCLFNYFPYGGLQRDFLRIAQTCRERGHEVHVYTMSWQGEREPGFHIHILPAQGWQNHSRNQAFAAIVKAHKPQHDLLIGFNKMPGLDIYYAADVCYQARAREKHGAIYRLSPRYRQLVELEASVFSRGKQTEILLISQKQQQEFTRYYQTEEKRFHLLPPGIARDRIAPPNAAEIREALRAAYQLKAEDFMLLLVGSGFKTKGLDRAIKGLAALDQALRVKTHLFVLGDDKAAGFKKLASKHNVAKQVHFLGGRPDVANFLLAADLLVHPAYHENTGTVLLEALVSGLPVLTVDVCGYAHYINDSRAGMVLSSPFCQSSFNTCLQQMLESPKSREWRQNGLAFSKQADIYDLANKAADFIEAYCPPQGFSHPDYDFSRMMSLRGESFRQLEGRLTQRVQIADQSYFIKQHRGIGWMEIFKNLAQLRLPVLGAKNEYLALQKLASLGIPVPAVAAYEQRGLNPARLQSYVLMQELNPVISLEELSKTWRETPPAFNLKQKLVAEVARIARIMHDNGINHRDFYICHFLLQDDKLYLIDLHRAQIRRQIPKRWRIKDLSGLYFSSKDSGLTKRDLFRFMKHYSGKSLRETLKDKHIWQKVRARGERLYSNHT